MRPAFTLFLAFTLYIAAAQDAQLLVPHLTSAMREHMSNAGNGFLVFDTDTKSYWYYQANAWYNLQPQSASQSMPPVGAHLRVEIDGVEKMRVDSVQLSVLFPDSSTIIGYDAGALNAALTNASADDQGKFNTFVGLRAGFSNNPIPTQCSTYHFGDLHEGGCGANNSFIGTKSGYFNLYARNNTFLGSHSGFRNKGATGSYNPGTGSSGSDNTCIGFLSGYENQHGYYNTFIGAYSGERNGFGTSSSSFGRFNTYVGTAAGRYNSLGFENVYVGTEAGGDDESTGGNNNVMMGYRAGYSMTGNDNVMIGHRAGSNLIPGGGPDRNVVLGYQAGEMMNGSNNVIIGYQAGEQMSGNDNVLIGYKAGQILSGLQHTLIIGNNSNNQLIYGEFNNGFVRTNGRLEVNSAAEATLATNGGFMVGGAGSANLTIDRNEMQARTDSAAADLLMQPHGGQLAVGNQTDPVVDKLLVETGTGGAPLRARIAAVTKFRVHGNGGVSIGAPTTPPADGLLVDGDVVIHGTQVAAATNLDLDVNNSLALASGLDMSMTVGNDCDMTVAGAMTIQVVEGLTLIVGNHTVEFHPTGITITSGAGSDITINSGGDLSLSASGEMFLDADTITLNGTHGNTQRAARATSLVNNPPCGAGCTGSVGNTNSSASVYIGN